MSDPVIAVKGLRKTYGEKDAVGGIDFEVSAGEVFAFLGPNGAGKTTTVEILEGYRKRTAGEVSVLGIDPARPTREWRSRIGFVLQTCAMEPLLTVRETLELFASYYPKPRAVDETIDLVGLSEKRDARASSLSGGQERRLDVALGLIGDPELLFLDEPSTGFDPSARRSFWNTIEGLRELGKTIFLTTHFMDEAQNLADRITIMNCGQIVAQGSPDELGKMVGTALVIRFQMPKGADKDEIGRAIGTGLETSGLTATVNAEKPVETLHALTGWALDKGVDLHGIELERPRLEDIYLELTEGEQK